jgi:hypothetical protein
MPEANDDEEAQEADGNIKKGFVLVVRSIYSYSLFVFISVQRYILPTHTSTMLGSVLRSSLGSSSARMLRASSATAATSTSSFSLFRSFSSGETASFDLESSFEVHNLEDAPSQKVECSKDELLGMFKLMYTMRRMEITCDNEYKARNIRGFCHLYDGQEAVATGIQNAFENTDSWITSYRCHCIALARGKSVSAIVGELFGNSIGSSGGKGGSMHFYDKKANFYGGQGIVGAQVPVGAGLAFANKYKTPPGEKMPVAIACYGDGAANQGQIWESANMSALWKLVRYSLLLLLLLYISPLRRSLTHASFIIYSYSP